MELFSLAGYLQWKFNKDLTVLSNDEYTAKIDMSGFSDKEKEGIETLMRHFVHGTKQTFDGETIHVAPWNIMVRDFMTP